MCQKHKIALFSVSLSAFKTAGCGAWWGGIEKRDTERPEDYKVKLYWFYSVGVNLIKASLLSCAHKQNGCILS